MFTQELLFSSFKFCRIENSITPMRKYKFIDVFSGCGGLSLGLHWAGFKSVLTVERSPMAAETYSHNLRARIKKDKFKKFLNRKPSEMVDAGLYVGDMRELLSGDLAKKIKEIGIREEVDLLAGGPPCQGFSMAGKRNPGDIRNTMPIRFLELVGLVSPKVVLIENVSGFRHRFVKHGSEQGVAFDIEELLAKTGAGYVTQVLVLNSAHYGVPQERVRTVIIGMRKDLAIDPAVRLEPWKSGNAVLTGSLAPVPTIGALASPVSVKCAIGDLVSGPKGQYVNDLNSMPSRYKDCAKSDPENNKERKHSEKVVKRFRVYQILCALGINPSKVMKLATKDSRTELKQLLRDLNYADAQSPDGKLRVTCAADLIDLLIELKTKKHSQRALDRNEPSPTVLTIPDDIIHYSKPRALTVREMARIQSFPDWFIFRGKETTGGKNRKVEVPQYTQVGNAVPPLLAYAIGIKIRELLDKGTGWQTNERKVGKRTRNLAKAGAEKN